MTRILLATPILLLALAGCATNPQGNFRPTAVAAPAPVIAAPVPTQPTPAQTTAAAKAAIDATPFLEAAAVAKLTPADKAQAANAQFYALQFGRPGAPRSWSSGGASGQVTVGPYVRVNNLDCRDFTHAVTIGGSKFARKGTACREQNGTWTVVDSSSVA